jgi:hypothetical protein
MREIVDKIKGIVQKHNEEVEKHEPKLFYDFFVNPEFSTELMIGPIGTPGDMMRPIAEKIAEKYEKYGIKLKEYDFSRDKWSNPRDYRLVFSATVPYDGSDFERIAKNLCAAQKELQEVLSRVVTI